MIGAFYGLGKDIWAGNGDIWTGIFGLMATVIISLMGGALLRVSKLQDKWRVKLAKALQTKDSSLGRGDRCKRWAEKYAMFLLPFVTVMREGLEAVIFLGGVSVSQPASSFPLAAISGLVGGTLVSYIVYRYGPRNLKGLAEVLLILDFQWWQTRQDPNLPHRLHLFLVCCRRGYLHSHRMVFRSPSMGTDCRW